MFQIGFNKSWQQFCELSTDMVMGGSWNVLGFLSIRELQRLNNLRDDAIFEGDVVAMAIELVDVRPGRSTCSLFAQHGPSMQNGLPAAGPSLEDPSCNSWHKA